MPPNNVVQRARWGAQRGTVGGQEAQRSGAATGDCDTRPGGWWQWREGLVSDDRRG